MEPLSVILNRFMRLLPFLAAPNSYRCSHYELFYPYPDIWNDSQQQAPLFFSPLPTDAARAPARPASPGVGRARASAHPVGHHARPYLGWNDITHSGSHRGDPFW